MDLDIFPAGFRGNGVTRFDAILNVQINGFTDIRHHLFVGVTLRNASRESWNKGYVSAIRFSL